MWKHLSAFLSFECVFKISEAGAFGKSAMLVGLKEGP